MARPKQGYPKIDGQHTPGASTVAKLIGEPGGLIHWAWQCGVDGKDYRQERDSAASAGTLAHEMVEAWAHGNPPVCKHDDPTVERRAQKAFEAFLEWANQSKLQILETEKSLISQEHKFGGTLDAMLINGRRALGDWKATNGIYADHFVQVAGGYKILWDENFPDQPIDGGVHIIRFDKTYGDFEHRYFSDTDDAEEAFKVCRRLYDLQKRLKKRIG